jgi:uncharacterized protein (DUF1778 family)
MPTLKRPREERVELRLNHEDKLTLEAAARHQGVTVSAYLLSHSLPAARQEAAQAILLAQPARDLVLDLLEDPKPFNPALTRAIRQANAVHGG